MTLKAYINGSMRKLTKQKMTTFVGGVKKYLPKGITFINGEKVVLWQMGEITLNSWILSAIGYPNAYHPSYRIYGLEATDNKVVFNVEQNISRSNVENISAPYTEGTQAYGASTYYKGISSGKAQYDSNVINLSYTRVPNVNPRTGKTTYVYNYSATLTDNTSYIKTADMEITASSVSSSSTSGASSILPSFGNYIDNAVYISGYGLCNIASSSGKYIIQKNFAIGSGGTAVVEISSNGYSGTEKPKVWSFAVLNDRYILFGAEYKATSGGDYVYSLKRVDITNGSVSTLLDNQPSPVLSVMVDGSNLIVTADNKMFKMNTSGTVSATYTSPNIMPTLVGKYNGYYYLTTTRDVSGRNYMNIEVVSDSNFTNGEVKQTDVKMVGTYAIPHETENGYLCFVSKHYVVSTVTGTQTTPSARTAILRATTSGTVWSEDEVRVCRLQCY